jgi:hypothetical protein
MEVGSSKFPNIALERRSVLILALAVSISISVYLVASAMIYRIGFPLDDAWIHQTYARNLALSGEWAFSPGHPSDGSTSPLWTGLIAIGYWLRLGPYIWTFFLGTLRRMGRPQNAFGLSPNITVDGPFPGWRMASGLGCCLWDGNAFICVPGDLGSRIVIDQNTSVSRLRIIGWAERLGPPGWYNPPWTSGIDNFVGDGILAEAF